MSENLNSDIRDTIQANFFAILALIALLGGMVIYGFNPTPENEKLLYILAFGFASLVGIKVPTIGGKNENK